MSLINDALKRATQTPSTPAASTPESQTPMQAVDYRRGGLPWFFFPSLLLILGGACWFIVKGIQTTQFAANPMTVHAREPQPQPNPEASIDTEPAAEILAAGIPPAPSEIPGVATPLPNRNFSLDDAPAATPVPEATPNSSKPAFKLQGIFYRAANPSATVNGKTVSVGSHVNGATITSITREGVTLDADGQTTVLTLE